MEASEVDDQNMGVLMLWVCCVDLWPSTSPSPKSWHLRSPRFANRNTCSCINAGIEAIAIGYGNDIVFALTLERFQEAEGQKHQDVHSRMSLTQNTDLFIDPCCIPAVPTHRNLSPTVINHIRIPAAFADVSRAGESSRRTRPDSPTESRPSNVPQTAYTRASAWHRLRRPSVALLQCAKLGTLHRFCDESSVLSSSAYIWTETFAPHR